MGRIQNKYTIFAGSVTACEKLFGSLRVTYVSFVVIAMAGVLTWSVEVRSQEVSWPQGFRYGNWCGLGVPSDPRQEPPEIDQVDAACRAHDFAYEQEPWGNSGADSLLVNTLTEILHSGESWNIGRNGERTPKSPLSDRQFTAATIIISYFTGQKFLTIYSDIINGKLGSVLMLGTSTARTAVVVPTSISNSLLTAFSEEVAEHTGIPLDEIDIVQSGTDLSVELTLEVLDLVDSTVEEVGDDAEQIVKTIGDVTGLDKPVREIREETILLLTNPAEFGRTTGQKVIDCVLPWRWSRC